ncbi:MAG: hypothetical protein FJX74_17980, partial [Armatimonadetes bacterium]|nr:hypothetical protein [Armatimonadota bacterium]
GALVSPSVRKTLTPDVSRLCGILTPVDAVKYLAACTLPMLPGAWPPGVDTAQALVNSRLPKGDVARLRQAMEQNLPIVEQACVDNCLAVLSSNIRNTDILALRCQSPSADLAADFANALAQEYIWYTQIEVSAGTKRDADSVRRMVEELSPKLAEKRSELVELMSEEGVADVGAALTSAVAQADKLTDLYEALRGSLEGDRTAITDLQAALRKQEGTSVSSRRVSSPNPALATFRDRLVSLEADRAALLETVTEAHPDVAAIDARIEEMKRRVEEELSEPVTSETTDTNPMAADLMKQLAQKQVQVAGDEVRLDALAGRVAASQAKLSAFPEKQRRIAGLQQELEVAERSYLALVEREQALTLSQIMEDTSVQILDPAVPPTAPLKPRKAQVLIVGAFLGTIGVFLLALLADLVANAVKSRSELEELIGRRPVFAEIPADPRNGRGLIGRNNGDATEEAFRSLRAAIQAALPADGPSTLLVTSWLGGEGKTKVACNLAAAYGAAGRRAVIVEADLHAPDLAERLGLASDVGLTTCLEGGSGPEEVIQDAGREGVAAVVAGPPTQHPARLIESQRLQELMQSLRQRADVLIVDAPAAQREADIRALAPLADGTLLVVDADRSPRPGVARAAALLEETSRLFLGTVLNRARGR